MYLQFQSKNLQLPLVTAVLVAALVSHLIYLASFFVQSEIIFGWIPMTRYFRYLTEV